MTLGWCGHGVANQTTGGTGAPLCQHGTKDHVAFFLDLEKSTEQANKEATKGPQRQTHLLDTGKCNRKMSESDSRTTYLIDMNHFLFKSDLFMVNGNSILKQHISFSQLK